MSEPSITPAEQAARRSRRGYEYQDLVAVSFCLQMFRDSALRKVACETQDDVVLTWADSTGEISEEFVQVKSDRQTQQWSVSLFCAQERETPPKDGKKEPVRYRKDTSIFEKNSLRDQGKHTSRFRIVTRADVNELRELTKPFADRKPEVIAELTKKVETQLEGNTTLILADIEYWMSAASWEVRGVDSAVFNESLRKLAEAVETQEQRLLPMVDLEQILSHLVDEASAMAMGKGRCGSNPSTVTSEELRKWLAAEVRAVPHFLGAAEVEALLREERNSLARCQGLWVTLGVSPEDADALARQPHIGARMKFFSEFKAGLHWVTAGYGAGKSLAVERLFQHQVADYAAKRDNRVPIFLRAPGIVGALRDAVMSRLKELHLSNGTQPLFVVLDALDEAGISNGHRLLLEAYELTITWPNSTCIATSVNLPSNLEQFRKPLPILSDDQAAEIVSYFARHEVYPWQVREKLKNDHGLAIMCVLLGQVLREALDAVPSRGELLNRIVEAARKRSGADAEGWAKQGDLLCRIAMLCTDAGGGPVSLSKLEMTSIDTVQITTSKLVVEDAGNLVFTVATMRLWFAAQALRKGLVDEKKLAADLPRLRHWVDPLAIFIATTDFDSAARYFEPLASNHPAVAAKVIANSTSQWGGGSQRLPSEFDMFAKRVYLCLEAWLRGVSPLANMCSFTDQNGALLNLRAGSDVPLTVIAFTRDQSLPPASAVPENWSTEDADQLYYYIEPDEPSHIWRKTHSMVFDDLLKFVERQEWELVAPDLIHEKVWGFAVSLAGASHLFASGLEWDVINRFEADFHKVGLWDWLCEKRSECPQAFSSPHPPADIRDQAISWIPAMFSPTAALARARSIYGMAFAAYQQIVIKYFPNFRHELRLSAWWPCRLIGEVSNTGGLQPCWWIDFHCEPVGSDKAAIVKLELGTGKKDTVSEKYQALREKVMSLRPNAPPVYCFKNSILELHNPFPATTLVKKWLLEDLKAAGWKL